MSSSPIVTTTVNVGVLISLVLLSACDSKKDEERAAPAVEARDLTPSKADAPDSTASQSKKVGSDAPSEKAVPEEPTAASSYSCEEDSIWTKKDYKALQTGALESLNEGVELPTLSFKACDGVERCQTLELAEGQKLLAVGQHGNDIKLVVTETCGDDTAVLIADDEGQLSGAFRAKEMEFESAKVGGDRFLLGGFARHRSETAKGGFVPREYLVTGRQGEFEKLEPARNKLRAEPVAAASQIVQVKTERGLCTTMFWKLGVEQCDFEGPASEGSILIGSQMIYPEGGKGMKWNAKEGSSELLPVLEWIVTDGVNVLWSTGDELFMTQPRFDLPELKSEALTGPPGERPLAFGCGRSLVQADDGWHLRNLKMGSEWVLPTDRFGGDLSGPLAMNCDGIVTGDGKKLLLQELGGLKTLGD